LLEKLNQAFDEQLERIEAKLKNMSSVVEEKGPAACVLQ
jgi:hypothetical protein